MPEAMISDLWRRCNCQWWALYRIFPVRRPSFVTGRPTSPSSVIRHYFGPVQSVIRRSVTPSLHFDHASVIAKLQFVTAVQYKLHPNYAENKVTSWLHNASPLTPQLQLTRRRWCGKALVAEEWKKLLPKVVFAFWAGDDSGDGLKKTSVIA